MSLAPLWHAKLARGICANSHSVAKLARTLPCLHSVASVDDDRWRCCDWRPCICCGMAQRTHMPRAAFCCFLWRTSGCGQVTTAAGAATAGGGGGADGRSKSAGLYTTCNTHTYNTTQYNTIQYNTIQYNTHTTASDTWVTNEADVRHARRCKKACFASMTVRERSIDSWAHFKCKSCSSHEGGALDTAAVQAHNQLRGYGCHMSANFRHTTHCCKLS